MHENCAHYVLSTHRVLKISAVTEQKGRARCERIKEMSRTGARRDELNIM